MPFYKIPEDAVIEFLETDHTYYLVINGQTYESYGSVLILTYLGDVYLEVRRLVIDYLTHNISYDDRYRIHSLDFKEMSEYPAESIEAALALRLVEGLNPNGIMVRFSREEPLLELPTTDNRERYHLLVDDVGNRWLEC